MASNQTNGTRGRRYLYCSYPRSASHLLMRMLNIHEQPGFITHRAEGDQYFFLPPYFERLGMNNFDQTVHEFAPEQRTAMQKSFQNSADRTVDFLKTTGDQNVFIKEHVQIISNPVAQSKWLFPGKTTTEEPWSVNMEGHSKVSPENPTLFPDEYLLSFLPFFTIRHPALVTASMARAFGTIVGSELNESAMASMRLATGLNISRQLYDFLEKKLDTKGWPVVLDAHDVIKTPQVVLKFMDMLQLDKSLMQSSWNKWDDARVAAMPPNEARMMSTLIASTGVQMDKAANVDLDAEFMKWREEFGPEMSAFMEKHVRDTMPDYEYLYSKRLQA